MEFQTCLHVCMYIILLSLYFIIFQFTEYLYYNKSISYYNEKYYSVFAYLLGT